MRRKSHSNDVIYSDFLSQKDVFCRMSKMLISLQWKWTMMKVAQRV